MRGGVGRGNIKRQQARCPQQNVSSSYDLGKRAQDRVRDDTAKNSSKDAANGREGANAKPLCTDFCVLSFKKVPERGGQRKHLCPSRRPAAKITVPSMQSDFPNHTLSYDARDESKDPPLVSYREKLSYISSETHTDAEMFAPRATCSIGADNTRKARRHGGLGRAPQSGRETARGTLKNGKDAGRLPSGRRRAHSVC